MKTHRLLFPLVAGALILAAAGCDRSPVRPSSSAGSGSALLRTGASTSVQAATGTAVVQEDGTEVPVGVVQVNTGGSSLSLWPYTGITLNGQPTAPDTLDPVNLLFVGDADPARIRAALLSLDGDRTAFGFPPVYPFNALWSDAIGDVQATYAGESGWTGSIIQLQLGVYDPVRVHLRLFRTSSRFGDSGTWTVGAAHFELRIPGTADHQVLSWELAEQIIVADLVRSGLLDPAHPMDTSDPINPAPGFRTIPSVIYNLLPADLASAIGGPPQPVSSDVPIKTDGRATILHLANHVTPTAGTLNQQFSFDYQQVIPKPFCSDGPGDGLLVTGPVSILGTHIIGGDGSYSYRSSLSGRLMATPMDLSTNPPKPVGEPFPVQIEDRQSGALAATTDDISGRIVRLATESGGSEFRRLNLRLSTPGPKQLLLSVHCK
jgi:hypothetical protein